MARNENPPFGRGETFFNGGTTDSTSGAQFEGKTWVFEDLKYNTPNLVGAKPARSNREVKCMCVRNVSGINLLPKRLANLSTSQTDKTKYLGQVDGYAFATAQRGYPIDEWLPAAGVPNNDLFWIVIEGPAMVLTDLAGGANNPISVGSLVVALTAVTSQATTAGHVYPQDLSGATALLGNQIQNRIGWSLSAVTTTNTGADLLVEVDKW